MDIPLCRRLHGLLTFTLPVLLLACAGLPPIPSSGNQQSRLVPLVTADGVHLLCLSAPFYGGTVSPDGRLVATTMDGEMAIWEIETGSPVSAISSGTERLVGNTFGHELAFSPDGTLIAAAGRDGRARVWHTASGSLAADLLQARPNELRTKPSGERVHYGNAPVAAVAFTPDGRSLVSGSSDGRVFTWATDTWTLRDSVWATEGWLKDLAVIDEGRTLAVASFGGEIRLWAQDRGLFLGEFRSPRSVDRIDAAPGDSVLAVMGMHRAIYLWARRSGLMTDSLRIEGSTFAFSPDGSLVAVPLSAGIVGLWNPGSRTWQRIKLPSERGTRLLAFTADGKRLLSGQQGDKYLALSPLSTADRRGTASIAYGQSPCD